MKSKIYNHADSSFEIQLENGSCYTSVPEESYDNFLKRSKSAIALEIDEEVTYPNRIVLDSTLAKLSVTALTKRLEGATGLHATMIEAAIENKGAKKAKPAAKSAKKAEAKVTKPKVEKAPKAPKMTVEQMQELADECSVNKGKVVTFRPFNQVEDITGVVKGIMQDKRDVSRTVFYRIIGLENNKTYHCKVNNPTFKIDEKATAEIIAAKAKAAAEAQALKDAAAKAKADEKEAKKAERARIKEEKAKKRQEAEKASEKAKAEKASKEDDLAA